MSEIGLSPPVNFPSINSLVDWCLSHMIDQLINWDTQWSLPYKIIFVGFFVFFLLYFLGISLVSNLFANYFKGPLKDEGVMKYFSARYLVIRVRYSWCGCIQGMYTDMHACERNNIILECLSADTYRLSLHHAPCFLWFNIARWIF